MVNFWFYCCTALTPYFVRIKIEPCFVVSDEQIEREEREAEAIEEIPGVDRPGDGSDGGSDGDSDGQCDSDGYSDGQSDVDSDNNGDNDGDSDGVGGCGGCCGMVSDRRQ